MSVIISIITFAPNEEYFFFFIDLTVLHFSIWVCKSTFKTSNLESHQNELLAVQIHCKLGEKLLVLDSKVTLTWVSLLLNDVSYCWTPASLFFPHLYLCWEPDGTSWWSVHSDFALYSQQQLQPVGGLLPDRPASWLEQQQQKETLRVSFRLRLRSSYCALEKRSKLQRKFKSLL